MAAATLSIEIARLRVELRHQLAEVERPVRGSSRPATKSAVASSETSTTAHSSASSPLASRSGACSGRFLRSADISRPALDQIVGEVGAAIADLRQIAAGVRPARLDDGLAAALRDLARSAPIPVDVEVPVERVAASIEAGGVLRRVRGAHECGEACGRLEASRCAPSGRTARSSCSVPDDGVGGAVVRRGSGLAGLQDRVAAHGGTLDGVTASGATPAHVNRDGDSMRLVIAEDAALLREGVAGLLEDAGSHRGSRASARADSLLAVVAEHEPDLAIVDVRMPPTYEDVGHAGRGGDPTRGTPGRPSSSSRSTSRACHAVELVGARAVASATS